jgi:hypothetical protein
MRCFYHHDKEAVGSCKSCGKGLCPECAVGHSMQDVFADLVWFALVKAQQDPSDDFIVELLEIGLLSGIH